MPPLRDDGDLARAARLYFIEGLSQKEVADKMQTNAFQRVPHADRSPRTRSRPDPHSRPGGAATTNWNSS